MLPLILHPEIHSMQASVEQPMSRTRTPQEMIERAYRFSDLSDYSLGQRLVIRAADLVFYSLIYLIGKTARFEVVGWENHEAATRNGGMPILNFWHEGIFFATYWFRHRRIVVLSSKSFDGEYIGRFIKRFGYGTVRGSSTRGAVGALIEMSRLMRAGCPTGFSIDGPTGPPHVAKMGSVLLAKKSGHPLLPFTITAKNYWKIPSWDSLQVPMPFTRAQLRIGIPIHVPSDADDAVLQAKRDELQAALDELNRLGDVWRSGDQTDTMMPGFHSYSG